MAVPANICVAWPSTVGSIPTGWTRETTLDSRYILGAAAGADTDLITDRGFTTHTHVSPSHTPIQNSHTHTISAAGNDAATILTGDNLAGSAADGAHGHDAFTSAAATGTNNGIAITVDTASNDLSYVEVIWIKSDGTPATLPSGCLAFFPTDVFPANWTRAHTDRYLKGAAAGLGGGGTAGANTHVHTSPAHTHTQNLHSHGAVTSTGTNLTTLGTGTGADIVATPGHTHSVSLQGQTPTNQSVTTTINSSSHEPPFSKINTILSSAATLPENIICLWLGLNTSIPTGWTRYAALNAVWAKGSSADGQVGTTGGGLVHSHTAADCLPVQDSHLHVSNNPASVGSRTANAGPTNTYAVDAHLHSWTVSTDTAVNQTTTVTINNCTSGAALPPHRTVIFIKFISAVTPPRRDDVYTSYGLGLFDLEDVAGRVLPEVAKKIAQGDLRYVPR